MCKSLQVKTHYIFQSMSKKQLTISEALAEGYTHAMPHEGNAVSIEELDVCDFEDNTVTLCAKKTTSTSINIEDAISRYFETKYEELDDGFYEAEHDKLSSINYSELQSMFDKLYKPSIVYWESDIELIQDPC